jgi:hypothetical protein
MYIVKDGFQRCLLVHFAERPRLTVGELVDLTLTKRAPAHTRRIWRTEVELACELLVLRKYLQPDPSSKEKAYLAAAHVRRPGTYVPVAPRRMNRMAAPLAAAMLLNACATTSMDSGSASSRGAPSYWGDNQAHPAPVVRVATPNTPPQATTRAWITAQIEQYPQDSGNAVYRMCYEDCPTATPKRPARIPIVVASAQAVPERASGAAATPAVAIPTTTKAAVPIKDGAASAIHGNELMQKSIADALASAFNAKPADGGSVKPKSSDARTVAAIPDESFTPPPAKAKKPKAVVKKPIVETTGEAAPAAAPVAATVAAVVSAPAVAPEPPVAAPPVVATAPVAVEPAKPANAVKRKYVDRKLDPNEGASPEERAKIDRLMEEARATTPAAKNHAPTAPTTTPAAVPAPGVGATADPGMRTVLTPSRTETPRTIAPVQLASVDPGPLWTIADTTSDMDPRDTLNAWVDAWSSRDATRYFGLYAKNFVAYDAQNNAEFIARRSAAMSLAKSIELKVEPVSVSIRGDHATIKFWQDYKSPRFASRVMKALELTKETSGWKIRRERLVNVVPTAPAKA